MLLLGRYLVYSYFLGLVQHVFEERYDSLALSIRACTSDLCGFSVLLIDTDSVGEYIAQGASSVVLSDAIFDKEAMGQKNFTKIYQLANAAALHGNEAVDRLDIVPCSIVMFFFYLCRMFIHYIANVTMILFSLFIFD